MRTPQGSFDPAEWHGDGWTISFTENILDSIGKDVQGAEREWMLSKVTPWPMRHVTDLVTLSENFDSVRSAYILCTGGSDNVEEILKENLDGPVKVIESGHWPMITKPHELVEAILSLAGSPAQ